MLRNTYFCVHIPKTGGTSFRKSLEYLVGSSNTYYDYNNNSSITNLLIKEIKYISVDLHSILNSEINFKEKSLICGHVSIMDYANIIFPQNIFTFIRNPVERVISHYEHAVRKQDYKGSLTDFCQEERFRNIQHKMLSGYPLHAIGFIGITDEFNRSIEQFQRQYGLALPQLELNRNTKKDISTKYDINEKTKSLIISMNNQDTLLFEKAKKIFSSRSNKNILKNLFGSIEVITKNNISGWCYKISDDQSFLTVEILINGSVVGTSKVVLFRPLFKQINAPRHGYVGFNYRFSNSIKDNDKITCRVIGTKHYLTNLNGDSTFSISQMCG